MKEQDSIIQPLLPQGGPQGYDKRSINDMDIETGKPSSNSRHNNESDFEYTKGRKCLCFWLSKPYYSLLCLILI